MKNKSNNKKNTFVKIIIILLIVIVTIELVSVPFTHMIIKDYNSAVQEYSDTLIEYKTVYEEIMSMQEITTQNDIVKIDRTWVNSLNPLNIRKKKEAFYLRTITEDMKIEISISSLVTNPSEDWVKSQLMKVEDINEMESVTSQNNPDGLLDAEGGYKACIYFSLNDIDQKTVEGESIVDKGNAAGGTIEVYETREEALERNEYLSGFDNTVLTSGSHVVLGTMVIRTSHLLDGEKQKEITEKIIDEMVYVDVTE